jgi:hypothetical protein
MGQNIIFESHVPTAQRSALEALVFFNSCQDRVAECIASAVEEFGYPEIVSDRTRLRLRIGDLPDVQSLFAVEAATARPVGVAVYTRPDMEHITVMHLGILPEYAAGGSRAGEQLLLRLVREVKRSTRRVKGVRRLELYYMKGRAQALRWRESRKVQMA